MTINFIMAYNNYYFCSLLIRTFYRFCENYFSNYFSLFIAITFIKITAFNNNKFYSIERVAICIYEF